MALSQPSSRRTKVLVWAVAAGVLVLILWGEWLEWRRKSFVMHQLHELRMQIEASEHPPR